MPVAASTFRKRQRQNPTKAEEVLWAELRNRQLGGYKFVRQISIGAYLVDFLCRRRKLIVELDGPIHVGRESYDNRRTHWLNQQGYSVARFSNRQIEVERPQVLGALLTWLEDGIVGANINFQPAVQQERLRS